MSDQRPAILFIEPKRNALGALTTRLSEAGFKVLPAASAADGIALLHRNRIDLMLSELRLPDKPASEIVRLMQEDVNLAAIPTLLITGKSDREGALEAYEAGADDVIAKPFDSDVLIARLKRRLQRSQAFERLNADKMAMDGRLVERAIELSELREEVARLRASD
ncbi:response regulator transcription factor [Sphingomicrobium flavum]|uniref:response regulator transcription factor n=1 Tax=Sphingomicrobium flavum TaxID=1229164 RepID=UPI0021AD8033|nr:response regulator [Sphingomicrobium flavum]